MLCLVMLTLAEVVGGIDEKSVWRLLLGFSKECQVARCGQAELTIGERHTIAGQVR